MADSLEGGARLAHGAAARSISGMAMVQLLDLITKKPRLSGRAHEDESLTA